MISHESHPDVIKRLKRLSGHLARVIQMIEEDRGCLEVAQQLQAVYSALSKAKQIYVQDHIENCIETSGKLEAAKLSRQMKELKEIAKYL